MAQQTGLSIQGKYRGFRKKSAHFGVSIVCIAKSVFKKLCQNIEGLVGAIILQEKFEFSIEEDTTYHHT